MSAELGNPNNNSSVLTDLPFKSSTVHITVARDSPDIHFPTPPRNPQRTPVLTDRDSPSLSGVLAPLLPSTDTAHNAINVAEADNPGPYTDSKHQLKPRQIAMAKTALLRGVGIITLLAALVAAFVYRDNIQTVFQDFLSWVRDFYRTLSLSRTLF